MEQISGTTLPGGIAFGWMGTAFQEIQAGQAGSFILLLSVLFACLFLVAQYESWTIPFPVILSIGIAVLGAAALLGARGIALDAYAQVGLVLLVGLVAKNAILIVEFAKQLREEGRPVIEAALEAATLRYRAVLMTAFSFVLGVMPLVFASGAGSASRQSVGTTVFGGMLGGDVAGNLLHSRAVCRIPAAARDGEDGPGKGGTGNRGLGTVRITPPFWQDHGIDRQDNRQ